MRTSGNFLMFLNKSVLPVPIRRSKIWLSVTEWKLPDTLPMLILRMPMGFYCSMYECIIRMTGKEKVLCLTLLSQD